MNYLKYKATTVITILVTIAIIGILVAIIVPSLEKTKSKQSLNGSVDEIVSTLVSARSKTLASYNSNNYGVHITSNAVTLFTGPTYSANGVGNIVKNLDTGVSISNISLAGNGSDVLFDRLKGSTDNYGTITVQVSGSGAYTKTITIERTGSVSTN